jgi:hypothetical protein
MKPTKEIKLKKKKDKLTLDSARKPEIIGEKKKPMPIIVSK